MSTTQTDHTTNDGEKATKAQKLADKASEDMRLAREAMERTRRVRRKTAFLPLPPAYKKIY
jgi:hypothetical protein